MKDVTPRPGWFSVLAAVAGSVGALLAKFAGGWPAAAAATLALVAGYAWGVDYGRRYIRANNLQPQEGQP